jgi:hypothetical protein
MLTFKRSEKLQVYGYINLDFAECQDTRKSTSGYVFLLATDDISILHDIKKFLAKHFDMKYLEDASFVLGIEICRDRSRHILGLS